jgi:hypothetical protein
MFSAASFPVMASETGSLKKVPATGSFETSVVPRMIIESYSDASFLYFVAPPRNPA